MEKRRTKSGQEPTADSPDIAELQQRIHLKLTLLEQRLMRLQEQLNAIQLQLETQGRAGSPLLKFKVRVSHWWTRIFQRNQKFRNED